MNLDAVTADEAAALLEVSRKSIYDYALRLKGFPAATYIGRTPLWDRKELIAWRAAHPARPSLRKDAKKDTTAKSALYRHWDERGVLLYIGTSTNIAKRGSRHAAAAQWAEFVATTEAQWFASREEAEAAERTAIETEGPVFNRTFAEHGRDDRISRYLTGRDSDAKRE